MSIAYSPDSRQLVTLGDDNVVRVWDVSTDSFLFISASDRDIVSELAFNSDGTRIITKIGRNEVRIWNVQTKSTLQALPLEDAWIGGLLSDELYAVWKHDTIKSISPDGKYAVDVIGETIDLIDTRTGRYLFVPFYGDDGLIWSAAFSPDGKRIATGGADDTVQVWDAQTGERLLTIYGHVGDVRAVAYSPTGEYIATASEDDTARIWDAQNGIQLLTLTGHTGDVLSVAFSPDGKRIVTSSLDGTVRLWWAVQSGQELIDYARECCVIRELTPEEREQFGLRRP
jgi:WD40 repeat protein